MNDRCDHVYPGCVCAQSDLAEKDAEIARLTQALAKAREEVERLTKESAFRDVQAQRMMRQRDTAEREVERLTLALQVTDKGECGHEGIALALKQVERARDEALAALRDACIGHADACGCAGCKVAFRQDPAASTGEGRK